MSSVIGSSAPNRGVPYAATVWSHTYEGSSVPEPLVQRSASDPGLSWMSFAGNGIRDRALRADVAVDVQAPDVAVEIDELGRADRTLAQSLEPVLDPHVVARAIGKAVLRTPAEQVDHVVLQGATHSVGVGLGV